MTKAFTASSLTGATCFTYSRDLRGPELVEGIMVDLGASKPGIYLLSNKSESAWMRYVAFDYRNPPLVRNDGSVLYAGVSEKGYLTVPDSTAPHYPLRLRVFDPMIHQLTGPLDIHLVQGKPQKRELVWKKHPKTGVTVGFEAVYTLQDSDVLAIEYPGGVDFLVCRNGSIEMLSNGSQIAKDWLDARHEKEIKREVSRAMELAATFPDKTVDWKLMIAHYSAVIDVAVRETFFSSLCGKIAYLLLRAEVNEEGRWPPFAMFLLFTLAEAVKCLQKKELLQKARRLLRNMEQRSGTDLPPIITEKFGYEHSAPVAKPIHCDSSNNEKRRRHELNLQRRAEENRARAKGLSGE